MPPQTNASRVFRRTNGLTVTLIAMTVLAGGVRAVSASDAVKIRHSRVTGLASFVTPASGRAISVEGVAGAVRVAPTDFLREYGHLFGVTAPTKQLVLVRTDHDALGYAHSTYHQVHDGVPVFAGVLKVHQDAAGGITAANGDFFPIPAKVNTRPTLTVAMAQEIAVAMISTSSPTVERSQLVIVDPGWYGDAPRGACLAYHIILTDPSRPLREAFFVEAHTGAMLDHWSMIPQAKSRQIYDTLAGSDCCYGHAAPGCDEATCQSWVCGFEPTCCGDPWNDECAILAEMICSDLCGLPGPTPARGEGDPPAADADVNAAYDYYGDIYDYYDRAFGRDGIDNLGMTMVATVNSPLPGCPNAYWSGWLRQMVFCTGTVTDDIVGHELTHGVTSYTAGLIYQNQSGQLNESFSDIFGELIDLFNGDAAFAGPPGGEPAWPAHPTGPGLDTPNNQRTDACSRANNGYADGVRWLMGEDASTFGGAIRDMWNPSCFGLPDRANSDLQICPVADYGGVHHGMGIPCHAFAMVTDGKAFNGYAVNGIGPIKAGAVWYRALTSYLTPSADFEDAYAALNQAALDLMGTVPNDPRTGGPSGSAFTVDDAAQVDQALRAVEMNTPGRCGQTVPVLDSEPPTECAVRTTIFADDFKGGVNGWTVSNSGPPTPYDWELTGGALPFDRPGTAWFCADRNIGDCNYQDESGTHSLYSPAITLPEDLTYPVLTFVHFVETERGWDGGNVKISINHGPWQVLSPAAFYYNRYNALPLNSALSGNTNPLAGEPGFTGVGGEWGKSVVHLAGIVAGGNTVQFRFDFGKDGCTGVTGWYLDDIEIYDCDGTTDCNNNGIFDDVEMTGGPRRDVLLQQPPTFGGAVYSTDMQLQGTQIVVAENVYLTHPRTIESIIIWGLYEPGDEFSVIFHRDDGGLPGAVVAAATVTPSWEPTGRFFVGGEVLEITLPLSDPVTLSSGGYFVEIYNRASTSQSPFLWMAADYIAYGSPGFAIAFEAPGATWYFGGDFNLAIEIRAGTIGQDCNGNGTPDDCETDCNQNGAPDECDIASGTSADCTANGIPDECEPDCNSNGVADSCDILEGTSADCSLNGVPDECEPDCNSNGIADSCDILDGNSVDCNGNGAPDECDVADGTSNDCNSNEIPDECDVAGGTSGDCDSNGMPDECQPDSDDDGVIDPCDECPNTRGGWSVDADGCATNQLDDDNDGITNDLDACPGTGYGLPVDENGCSDEQRDDDNDGVPNGEDGCRDDPNKAAPGQCGCGNPDTNSDGDSAADCIDECPDDPHKVSPGACGCGVLDTDSDHDGVPDCVDQCPNDSDKTVAGECGCGSPEGDSDQDGVPDCNDGCPTNPAKTEPGVCGCLTPETDSDRDGTADCKDQCPDDPNKKESGQCGCGTRDVDTDGDGTADCRDDCPEDPNKTERGACGCGESDDDLDHNGIPDCTEDGSGDVSSAPPEPANLTVSGPIQVAASSSAAYSAEMEYSDDSVVDVTHEVAWAVYSVELGTSHAVYTGAATISSAGVLAPRGDLTADVELMVFAVYRVGIVELEGSQLVTAVALEPEAQEPAPTIEADVPQGPRLCGFGVVGALFFGLSTLALARVCRRRRFDW